MEEPDYWIETRYYRDLKDDDPEFKGEVTLTGIEWSVWNIQWKENGQIRRKIEDRIPEWTFNYLTEGEDKILWKD